MASLAARIREFTEGARGPQPDRPRTPMTRDQVEFLLRMVLSECVELAQTVTPDAASAESFVRDCVGTDVKRDYRAPSDSTALIAEQEDAKADIIYYLHDSSCRQGVNLSSVVDCVHAANMAKKWPDGAFHRRPEDGKIIKPPNWSPPDITAEIQRQIAHGAW